VASSFVFICKWLLYQPFVLRLGTCLHLWRANKTAAIIVQREPGNNVEMQRHYCSAVCKDNENKEGGGTSESKAVENPMRNVAAESCTVQV
jgi:hypothetical protein